MALVVSFVMPIETAYAADYSYIKVKLSSMGSVSSISIKINGSYYLKESPYYPLVNGKSYTIKTSGTGIAISDGESTTYIGATATFIRTQNDTDENWMTINNSAYGWINYPGDVKFARNGSYIDTICTLFMETYLVGVVAHEMSPSWPAEALKAQAVAARTYAMRYISASNTYDVVDTTSNQVYKGYNPDRDAAVVVAVNATAGEVLMWGSTFADGVYSASNGGQTMTRVPKWGSVNYYHVLKDDPYDKKNPASPKFEFFFPKVITTTSKLDSRLDSMIRTLSVDALKSDGITAGVSDITIKGIESVTAHTLPPATSYGEYPDGSYQYTKIDVTAIIDYSGDTTIPVGAEEELAFITTGVVTLQSSTRMRIRSGPSTSYSIAGYIDNGETLDVYDIRDDDWLAIKYGDITGYVMKIYVDMAEYEEQEETPEELSIPGTVTGTEQEYTSVYKEASLDSSVESALTGTTLVTIVEYIDGETEWLKIVSGDVTGYVLDERIEYDKSLLENEGDTSAVEGHKVTVTLNYSALQEAFASSSSYLKYHNILSVSESASGEQIILAASRYGHGIGMSQRGAQQMAYEGWVYTDILEFYYGGTVLTTFSLTENNLPDAIDTPLVTARTTTDNVNVRKGPSTSYSVITSIDTDVNIYVISVDDWCNVYIPSLKISGYMSKDYLKITYEEEDTLKYADVIYHDGIYKVTASSLNLRTAPVIANNITCEMSKDTLVKRIESNGSWYKVIDTNDNIGWCSSDYLIQTGDAVEEPTPTPEATSTPEVTESVEPTETPEPTETASAEPTVTPETSETAEVTATPEITATPEVTATATSTPEVSPTATAEPTATNTPEVTPTYTPEPTATPDPNADNELTGTVNTDGTSLLRIRNDASVSASIIGYIPHGAVITILEDRDDGWLYINYETKLGYVIDDYVIYDGVQEVETGDSLADEDTDEDSSVVTGTVSLETSSRLRIRSQANTTSSILGYVPNGAQLQVLETLSTGWLKIEYGGLSGYVYGDYVVISSAGTAIGTIVDCSYLSVRTGNNTSYTRIGVVAAGTKHELLGENDGWYKINFEGKEGWISGKYVSVENADFAELSKEGVTTATSLRVREGPGLTYEQIGSLAYNSSVVIVGEENGFYKIDYAGGFAYISKAYVDLK